jgi:DNA-binding NtrC family response regulator
MKKADILLVDDEVVFATNMSRLLSSRGYQVAAVNNGEEAIRALKEKPFDVMVLDLKMSLMDGITTLQQMKKLNLLTEVLILTGHGSMDTAFQAIEMGAYDYVTKPCEIAELVSKIVGMHLQIPPHPPLVTGGGGDFQRRNKMLFHPVRLY